MKPVTTRERGLAPFFWPSVATNWCAMHRPTLFGRLPAVVHRVCCVWSRSRDVASSSKTYVEAMPIYFAALRVHLICIILLIMVPAVPCLAPCLLPRRRRIVSLYFLWLLDFVYRRQVVLRDDDDDDDDPWSGRDSIAVCGA